MNLWPLALPLILTAATPASTPDPAIACVDPDVSHHLVELSLHALDTAYGDRIEQLYASWMKDPAGQPGRAQVGAAIAIRAWLDARRNIVRFEVPDCAN